MMQDHELADIIKAHIEQGLGSDHGEVSDDREEVFDRYTGELYGNELEGESKVTTRDVMETIEWALPALMRHFAGTETPVEFDAEGSQDEDAAQLETEAVRTQFWKDNPGFTTLYLMFKTVMMNPNGYIKVFREEKDRVVFEHYHNMTLADVAMIEDDDELELVEAEEIERDEDHLLEPDVDLGPLHTVKVKRKLTKGRNLVLVLPEDEVVIDADWQHLDLDECPFVCHYPDKTQSELMLMGVPEDLLDEIYGAGEEADSSEETNRRNYSDETLQLNESHKALRKFRYHECSMLVDYDDDGIAERRRVIMINDHIWENEEDDEQTIIAAASILMPHKHIGMSLAQTVLDLQEIKTTIWRQLFNNMYRMNNPRTIVTKGANLADVLANRTNGILRATTKDDISIEETRPIIGQVIPLLDLVEQAREMRTGITKNSTVPDENMMRDTAQGSFLAMVERADQRIDLLARLFGETIVKQIYLKLHRLIKQHGDLYELRFEGRWVQTDPTSWRDRHSMTCRVGTGFNSKQARLQAAKIITADHNYLIENNAIAVPEEGKRGIVTLENVYAGRRLMVEALGEDVSKYYINPRMIRPAPPKQPAPDPNMMLIQANMKIEGDKRQVEIMKMQQEQGLKQMQLQAEYALKQREFQFKQVEQAFQQKIEHLETQAMLMKGKDAAEQAQHKLEVESLKAQLQDAQAEERLQIDKYKADLAAQTQITLKEMDLGGEVVSKYAELVERQRELADVQSGSAESTRQLSQMQAEARAQQEKIMGAVQQLSNLIEEMRQPKEIAYDDDGEIIGVRNPLTGEVKPIRRDAQGNPIGIT